MSKFDPLWNWIAKRDEVSLVLSFEEIGRICGFPIDHSFLTFKKELLAYGYRVGKISMKEKNVAFEKI